MDSAATSITADSVRETSDRIFNEGDLDYVDEAYTEDLVMHHVPSGEDYEGIEAFKQWIREFRQSFPDFEVSVDDVIVGEEKFVTQWTGRGTHRGPLPGVTAEPTNEAVTFEGVTVHRVEDGKAAEAWWYYDQFGVLAQLGLVPETATA
jgi:steroid delta-isomerase-like uncharacterized protein